MKLWAQFFKSVTVVVAAYLLTSCQVPPLREIIFEDKVTQLQIRSIRSRTFDMTDRIKAMRAVITTLQDLDFVINQADSRLGIITATKLRTYDLHITVKVDEHSSGRVGVRAQLYAGLNPLTEDVYQEFFASLAKNFFLTAHLIPPLKSLALEEPSELIEKPAPTRTSDTLSLRKEPEENLKEIKIKDMLSQYGFYDSQLNPDGTCRNHFIDNQNGTITDLTTGLMWQRSGSRGVLRKNYAFAYIKDLNNKNFAGYSDWRIPTIEELASLLEKDKRNGVHIDPVFDAQQIRCWSHDGAESMHISDLSTAAWVADYHYGKIKKANWYSRHEGSWTHRYEVVPDNYVRAVRSVR